MQRLKLYVSSVHCISQALGRKGSSHASSVTSDALHPMSNLLLSLSMLLYWSVIDSAEGVWNVSVIIFGAFFCNKREAQTVTQSVWWVGAHAEIQTAQTGRQSNGWWRLLAEKIIWSTEIEKLRLARTEQKTSLFCWLMMLWETQFSAQMVRFCLHYQSRLHLFTHLCSCDKQIVAIIS